MTHDGISICNNCYKDYQKYQKKKSLSWLLIFAAIVLSVAVTIAIVMSTNSGSAAESDTGEQLQPLISSTSREFKKQLNDDVVEDIAASTVIDQDSNTFLDESNGQQQSDNN